jgi:hypothetical protein
MTGRRAFTSSAIHTSCGVCVVSSWNLKSGEEADYTARNLLGCHGQTVVFADACLSKDVDTAGGPGQNSPAVET